MCYLMIGNVESSSSLLEAGSPVSVAAPSSSTPSPQDQARGMPTPAHHPLPVRAVASAQLLRWVVGEVDSQLRDHDERSNNLVGIYDQTAQYQIFLVPRLTRAYSARLQLPF
jgi:hypothetical protein